MRATAIVERDELPEISLRLGNRVVGLEINLLVFDHAPQQLDEDVIASAAFATHADLDAARLEGTR